MADVIYTTVPGKIRPLLAKLKDVGVPDKVTADWLRAIGFTSSNDRSLLGVLKLVGLTNGASAPTDLWQRFRGPKGKAALGEGIKAGYAELYSVYPDAHARPSSEIEQVFSMSTKVGKEALGKIVSTFKNLAAEAEFEESTAEELHVEAEPLHAPIAQHNNVAGIGGSSAGPSLHIDLQIHISPDANVDQIEAIFASMAKHLYGARVSG